MANEWHVPYEALTPETQDMARAIQSLMEELEAVDWYNQRAQVAHDQDLRRILEHNRDEEKEHASILLEWIRRRDPKFDLNLKTYLFTQADILAVEEAGGRAGLNEPESSSGVAQDQTGADAGLLVEGPAVTSFTVGSLRQVRGVT